MPCQKFVLNHRENMTLDSPQVHHHHQQLLLLPLLRWMDRMGRLFQSSPLVHQHSAPEQRAMHQQLVGEWGRDLVRQVGHADVEKGKIDRKSVLVDDGELAAVALCRESFVQLPDPSRVELNADDLTLHMAHSVAVSIRRWPHLMRILGKSYDTLPLSPSWPFQAALPSVHPLLVQSRGPCRCSGYCSSQRWPAGDPRDTAWVSTHQVGNISLFCLHNGGGHCVMPHLDNQRVAQEMLTPRGVVLHRNEAGLGPVRLATVLGHFPILLLALLLSLCCLRFAPSAARSCPSLLLRPPHVTSKPG